LILDDARNVHLFSLGDANHAGARQQHDLRQLDGPTSLGGWIPGPAIVRDLVRAVRVGGTTSCDVEHARRATEIGFAIHMSSKAGGARIKLPLTDRSLRVQSFPWGNE